MKTVAGIILMAGNSTRYGKNRNKNLEKINHKPIFLYSVEVFEKSEQIQEIILVIKEKERKKVEKILEDRENKKTIQIVIGGNTRQESVYHAISEAKSDIVIIHDGARPAIKNKYIEALIEEMEHFQGASIAVKSKDTIKITDQQQIVSYTTYRPNTWIVQTPQCFHRDILLSIHEEEKRKSRKY